MAKKAVVLLSGGLDSTTVLAVAKSKDSPPTRSASGTGSATRPNSRATARVADAMGVEQHLTASVDLTLFGGSASRPQSTCQSSGPTTRWQRAFPSTYVPARNTIFLSFALAWAEVLEADDIFIGVNALDYSGYPDCRPEYIHAYERMANLATKAAVEGRQRLTRSTHR